MNKDDLVTESFDERRQRLFQSRVATMIVMLNIIKRRPVPMEMEEILDLLRKAVGEESAKSN